MISPSTINAMMLAQERSDQLRRAERKANHASQPRPRRSLHLPSFVRSYRRTPVKAPRAISPRPGA